MVPFVQHYPFRFYPGSTDLFENVFHLHGHLLAFLCTKRKFHCAFQGRIDVYAQPIHLYGRLCATPVAQALPKYVIGPFDWVRIRPFMGSFTPGHLSTTIWLL